MNKKITFSYSDSSDDEEDDDNDEASEEENQSEKPTKEGVNGGSNVEENADASKKDDQVHEAAKQSNNIETSVDKLIEAEIKELGDKSKRRFFKLDSGCNGVVLIQMRKRDGDPSPTEIVQHMMESASATKKHMSRFLLRVLPIEVSCYASDEEITKAIKPLIEQYFPANSETPAKFAVQYDARANSGIERMKIIDAVAKSVPEPHKVDLKNPEKTIIVQVVKTVCLIGVVEKYKELAKYNLRQLTSPQT
ncbi:THUMP domain-containing protein 1 [Bienertia sinuspersici]